MCNHKNKIILWKKPAESKKRKSEEDKISRIPIGESTDTLQQPPKKKRKKDKSAGLLYTFNKLSVKKVAQPCQQKKMDPCKQPSISNVPAKVNVPAKTNVTKEFSRKLIQNVPKNKNQAKKQNAPKAKMKNVPQQAPKRNSLLLLANALKAKSSQSGSPGDKLKQMLK